MTAPQPGDRVRVTYEGVWTEPCHVQVFVGKGAAFEGERDYVLEFLARRGDFSGS